MTIGEIPQQQTPPWWEQAAGKAPTGPQPDTESPLEPATYPEASPLRAEPTVDQPYATNTPNKRLGDTLVAEPTPEAPAGQRSSRRVVAAVTAAAIAVAGGGAAVAFNKWGHPKDKAATQSQGYTPPAPAAVPSVPPASTPNSVPSPTDIPSPSAETSSPSEEVFSDAITGPAKAPGSIQTHPEYVKSNNVATFELNGKKVELPGLVKPWVVNPQEGCTIATEWMAALLSLRTDDPQFNTLLSAFTDEDKVKTGITNLNNALRAQFAPRPGKDVAVLFDTANSPATWRLDTSGTSTFLAGSGEIFLRYIDPTQTLPGGPIQFQDQRASDPSKSQLISDANWPGLRFDFGSDGKIVDYAFNPAPLKK